MSDTRMVWSEAEQRRRFYAEEADMALRSGGKLHSEEPNVRVWARAVAGLVREAGRCLSPGDFERLKAAVADEFLASRKVGCSCASRGPGFACSHCSPFPPAPQMAEQLTAAGVYAKSDREVTQILGGACRAAGTAFSSEPRTSEVASVAKAMGRAQETMADRARAADQLNTSTPNDCAGSVACDHEGNLCGAMGPGGGEG